MSRFNISLVEDYISIAGDGDSASIENLKSVFLDDLPSLYEGEEIFNELQEEFSAEELPAVCAELILTITDSCERDDFHEWDFDHLSFIIELSNKYDFKIPSNLLNGLPAQLMLLVDHDRIDEENCR